MLNDQRRRSDPDAQPVDVVVTSQTPPRTVETTETVQRIETVPPATRVDVYPAVDPYVNELAVDPVGRPLRSRREVVGRRRFEIGKSIDILWFALGVLEVVLALRFFFELTAANSAAGFVKLILGISQPFAWPFAGIFPIPRDGNNVFDTNILIAMAVYALLAWGISRILAMTIEPPSVV